MAKCGLAGCTIDHEQGSQAYKLHVQQAEGRGKNIRASESRSFTPSDVSISSFGSIQNYHNDDWDEDPEIGLYDEYELKATDAVEFIKNDHVKLYHTEKGENQSSEDFINDSAGSMSGLFGELKEDESIIVEYDMPGDTPDRRLSNERMFQKYYYAMAESNNEPDDVTFSIENGKARYKFRDYIEFDSQTKRLSELSRKVSYAYEGGGDDGVVLSEESYSDYTDDWCMEQAESQEAYSAFNDIKEEYVDKFCDENGIEFDDPRAQKYEEFLDNYEDSQYFAQKLQKMKDEEGLESVSSSGYIYGSSGMEEDVSINPSTAEDIWRDQFKRAESQWKSRN